MEEWRLTNDELVKLKAGDGDIPFAQKVKKEAYFQAQEKSERIKCAKREWKCLGLIIVDKDEFLVADCRPKKPVSVFESYKSSRDKSVEELTADAHLIAAAPLGDDLATAILAEEKDGLDRWEWLVDKAIAFKKKAEGK